MNVEIKCPYCGTVYEAEQKDLASSIACETCGREFSIGNRVSRGGVGKNGNFNDNNGATSDNRCISTIPLWICAIVLFANLIVLVCVGWMMYSNTMEMRQTLAVIKGKLSNMCEDITNIDGRAAAIKGILSPVKDDVSAMKENMIRIYDRMKSMDDSRHHDASQIYDRMGRMKLY